MISSVFNLMNFKNYYPSNYYPLNFYIVDKNNRKLFMVDQDTKKILPGLPKFYFDKIKVNTINFTETKLFINTISNDYFVFDINGNFSQIEKNNFSQKIVKAYDDIILLESGFLVKYDSQENNFLEINDNNLNELRFKFISKYNLDSYWLLDFDDIFWEYRINKNPNSQESNNFLLLKIELIENIFTLESCNNGAILLNKKDKKIWFHGDGTKGRFLNLCPKYNFIEGFLVIRCDIKIINTFITEYECFFIDEYKNIWSNEHLKNETYFFTFNQTSPIHKNVEFVVRSTCNNSLLLIKTDGTIFLMKHDRQQNINIMINSKKTFISVQENNFYDEDGLRKKISIKNSRKIFDCEN